MNFGGLMVGQKKEASPLGNIPCGLTGLTAAVLEPRISMSTQARNISTYNLFAATSLSAR